MEGPKSHTEEKKPESDFGWKKNKLDDPAKAAVIFAKDISLEEAREAVKDRPEFAEKEQEDFIVFNYKVQQFILIFWQWCNSKTFPNPNLVDEKNARILRIRRFFQR